jgi:DNA (cytosine-5)-methyltransferase 1
VPQLRERLYLVGTRDDLNIKFKFPRPTHGPDSLSKTPYLTANDVIGNLDDPLEEVPPYGGKYGHLIPEIPEGENYRHFTEEMGYPNPQFAWRSKFSGFLYKMAKNEPCRTIVSQQSRYDGPLHWRNRKCTTRELKRLQGFPDEMQIPHSYVVAVKQIGNSVTPPVANAIGRALRFQIEDRKDLEIPLLETNEKLTFDSRKGLRARYSRGKKATTYQTISSPNLFENEENLVDLVFDNPTSEEVIGNLSVINFEYGQFRGLQINGNCKDDNGSWFTLYLEFRGEFGNRIKGVSVKGAEIVDTCEALRVAWVLLHRLVSSISSYESLQPLWGHFTEPYPKFSISFESSGNDLALNLQEFAIIRAIDKSPISDEFLRKKFGSVQAVIDVGASIGLDIRTNATNRTVKEGEIRICYPFASFSK